MLINHDGVVLVQEPLRDSMDLGDRDLKGAVFTGTVLSGLELSGADLAGADFSQCDLYWLDLFHANCSDACFRGATLEGANFKSACLLRADLSNARIGPDRLGRPSSFAHADLTDAKFDETVLIGTEYDSQTVWPLNRGFSPEEHGMILVEIKDDWLIPPPCKEH